MNYPQQATEYLKKILYFFSHPKPLPFLFGMDFNFRLQTRHAVSLHRPHTPYKTKL